MMRTLPLAGLLHSPHARVCVFAPGAVLAVESVAQQMYAPVVYASRRRLGRQHHHHWGTRAAHNLQRIYGREDENRTRRGVNLRICTPSLTRQRVRAHKALLPSRTLMKKGRLEYSGSDGYDTDLSMRRCPPNSASSELRMSR